MTKSLLKDKRTHRLCKSITLCKLSRHLPLNSCHLVQWLVCVAGKQELVGSNPELLKQMFRVIRKNITKTFWVFYEAQELFFRSDVNKYKIGLIRRGSNSVDINSGLHILIIHCHCRLFVLCSFCSSFVCSPCTIKFCRKNVIRSQNSGDQ